MSDDKIYSKYGKIVSMLDDLQAAGCFDTSFSQPIYRIAVCGPNKSGKDSLINALLGYPFLPVNCPTQRAMEIRLVHTAEDVTPMVKVDEGNKTLTQWRDCTKYLGDLQMQTTDSNRTIPIRMNLTTNTSADLVITSCCELDSRAPASKSVIKEAIAPSCNFIILCMDALCLNDDRVQERDFWFKLIKDYDPGLQRTMVVFTKCDALPNNFNFNKMKTFLRESNEIFSPQFGFACVRCNFQHIDPSEQVSREREYFCNHKVFGYLNINDYFTCDTVGEKITKWIYSTYDFKKTLVFSYAKLQDRMKFVDEELQKYGSELMDFSSQSKDLYLQSMMNVFCETVEKAFSGKCEIEEYNLSNTNLRKAYVDFLGEYMDYRPSISFKNEDIVQTIQRTEKSFLNGFPSGDVIYALLDKQIEELRDELKKYLDYVYDTVTTLIKNIIQRYFSRFPKAVNSIEELVMSFLDREYSKTREIQNDLAEMNFSYIYVDEMTDKYKSLMQHSLQRPQPQMQPQQQQGLGAAQGFGAQNQQMQNNQFPPQQQQNYPFKDNNEISFFKSSKDKNSYYQGLADYVKSLVDYIYAEMIRCLREYVPKASGNFFIKSLKSNMRFFLLQYISKNPEFSQELEEDQEVAQKRTYYIESQKKLKKIMKTISYDDQITKIVKGDNMKNIENILQDKGINVANSLEAKKQEEEKKKQEAEAAKKSLLSSSTSSGTQANSSTTLRSGAGSNLFGVPPKKEANSLAQSSMVNTSSSQANKTNLFGPSAASGNQNKSNAKNTTNLFGTAPISGTANKSNAAASSNLFGKPSSGANTGTKKSTMNNLFGTPTQTRPTNNNLFGNPQNPSPNMANQGMNLNLKIDPKTGGVGIQGVQGTVDPKDVYNFYQKNKQYMPSASQMMKGAQMAGNFMGQANQSTGGGSKGLASLFGTGKK